VDVNRPEVLAEVAAAFQRYETALVTNDVPVLDELFWASPLTVRYGAGESLYGHDEISRFRRDRHSGDLARQLLRTVITTYGRDLATACAEFRPTGSGRRGRQTQTWVRTGDGWRIVAAHVSTLDRPTG
jgi:hypothetical protein